uniref:Predicted protein n=1 Tax=Physcomitrium patens TaxID=3218 RepID=A9TZN2_PHYPA
MRYVERKNFTRDDLKRVGNNIRQITGWDDPIDRLFVHAYIARSQYEALIEEKRRRDENNEGPSKRITRGEKVRQQKNSIHEETMKSISTKEREIGKEKAKARAYKLQLDIEAAIDLKKELYNKGKWPIDTEHGWMIRAANNSKGNLYGACPNIKVTIGDVIHEQNFFLQDMSTYPIILGQPYIISTRMETKVMDDGSAYARIRSQDGMKAVQFLIVCANHEKN